METWYVMEDGAAGDPREIRCGKDGRLHHKDGRAVAYRPDGVTPRSRGIDPDAERKADKQPFGGKGDHDGDGRAGGAVPGTMPAEDDPDERDMQPERPKRGYRTRASKAE